RDAAARLLPEALAGPQRSGLEGRQVLPLGLPHLVEELLDLVERAHRRGQRVDRERVQSLLPVVLEQRLDDELVHGHVRAVERGQLLRQLAEVHRVEAVRIDLALDLDTALRQVVDRAVVRHVAPDAGGLLELHRLDDVRAVFVASRARDLDLAREHVADPFVVRAAPVGPVVRIETALAEVAGARVLLDEVRTLAVVRDVLREVAARLGHERPEVEHEVETDGVLLVDLRLLRRLSEGWVLVDSVVVELGEPGVVVDARDLPLELLVAETEVARDLPRRALDAVAEADDRLLRRPGRRERQDRHRVRVVQDHGPGREAPDVGDDVEPRGPGAQRLEDAARADRVADALVDAVLHWDVVVGADIAQTGDLDRVDDVVGAGQDVGAVRRRLDLPALARERDQLLGDVAREGQAGRVDVDQGECAALEAVDGEDVGDDLAGEDGAAGADHRDFWHGQTLSSTATARRRPQWRSQMGRVIALRAPLAAVLAAAAVLLVPAAGALHADVRAAAALNGLKVTGHRITDASGKPVMLRGVNRSGTEYACQQGWGIFDGPADAASVQAMTTWHINYVRVLLNEDCWLDINGIDPSLAGTNYQTAIKDYVDLLNGHGIYVELSLIFASPGTHPADHQPAAPSSHSVTFWGSVAAYFKNFPNVFFGVWGEPAVDAS